MNDTVLQLASVGNSDAHVLEGIGTAWTWFPGASAAEYRAAVEARATRPDGAFWIEGEDAVPAK